jgi:hypothetical protein
MISVWNVIGGALGLSENNFCSTQNEEAKVHEGILDHVEKGNSACGGQALWKCLKILPPALKILCSNRT